MDCNYRFLMKYQELGSGIGGERRSTSPSRVVALNKSLGLVFIMKLRKLNRVVLSTDIYFSVLFSAYKSVISLSVKTIQIRNPIPDLYKFPEK